MDKVKYIINCDGKKTIFNSEEKYIIFKSENLNCTFTEKKRTEVKFVIIEIDMSNNNPIPLPNPDETTNKEIMKTLNDFIKELREFNKKQDKRWIKQEKFNKKQDERWERQEKFNNEQREWNIKIIDRIDNLVLKNNLKE